MMIKSNKLLPAPGTGTWKVSKFSAKLKTAEGKILDFVPAPFDIAVVDVWPPGRLTDAARDAYDKLARAGRIRPQGTTRDAAGRVIVRYLADCPERWIHEELRAAKYAGRQMGLNNLKRSDIS